MCVCVGGGGGSCRSNKRGGGGVSVSGPQTFNQGVYQRKMSKVKLKQVLSTSKTK